MANVTYLLGAGASFNSCPIWREQGEKMIEMSLKFLDSSFHKFEEVKFRNLITNPQQRILWDIGYFGYKSIEYGTIDTYARKLFLSSYIYDKKELRNLKIAVSYFFGLWETSNDEIKKRIDTQTGKEVVLSEIDQRYISLLSTILQKSEKQNPKVNDNIRFISWNYDLQLEKAYLKFCSDGCAINDISRTFSFRLTEDIKNLNVCHLNGYCGYFYSEYYDIKSETKKQKENFFINQTESKEIAKILEYSSYFAEEASKETIDFTNHINYAWEDNPTSKKTREIAMNTFSETDILVIIGYSFPPFNKEIDKMLFQKLYKEKVKIYYQDPKASVQFLSALIDYDKADINVITDKLESFFLPYDF